MINRTQTTRLAILLAGALLLVGCSALPLGALMGHHGSGAAGTMMGSGSATGGQGRSGFVAGTAAAPRVVPILAGPGYEFTPSTITVVPGETIAFEVTAVGPSVHEFKVGPLAAVLADGDVPEIAGIAMMQTRSLTYTFAGAGPFGFACHEPGHFEAGMVGRIFVTSG